MDEKAMKPEDFRKLLIPSGTRISLISGEGGDWNWENRPIGILERYIVAERLHRWGMPDWKWDTAAIMALDKPIRAVDVFSKSEFFGGRLLLFHRYPVESGTQYKNHWEATDPTTLAFGIQTPIAFDETPLSLEIWKAHCILLDYFATLLTEDPPSEIARLLIARRKNSPNS